MTGNGAGCTITGQVAEGDGFRAFFRGSASATGCDDAAFDGDYRLRLERYGDATLLARMSREDATGEASIEATLASSDALPAVQDFSAVAGDWSGTVGWVATQTLITGNAVERDAANKPLALSIDATGAVSGEGYGCAFTGRLTLAGGHGEGGLGGSLTASGCEQALYDGDYVEVRVRRAGAGRIAIGIERETRDAQGATQVHIEGLLRAPDGSGSPPPPPDAGLVTGDWQGPAGFVATQHTDGQDATQVAVFDTLQVTIGADGAFAGSGDGCTLTGQLTLAFDGRAIASGTVSASGCDSELLDGTYSKVHAEREDHGALAIVLEREERSGTTTTRARIGAHLSRPAP